MSTELANRSALTPAKLAELRELFGIPDVSGMDLSTASAEDKATAACALGNQIAKAQRILSELVEPVQEAVSQLQHDVFVAIKESGGKLLPHQSLDVGLEQDEDYDKRTDVLLQLFDHLSAEKLRKAIWLDSVKFKGLDIDQAAKVAELVGTEPDLDWKTNATQLNKLASDYGPASEIAKIVADGCKKVLKGNPKLYVRERK